MSLKEVFTISSEALIVLIIFLITVGLLASNRVRIDVIGFIVMTLLGVTQVVSTSTLFSGFSSEAVILIAGMLALGEALVVSGTTAKLGWFMKKVGGKGANRLATVLMSVSAVPSAFISDVGLVGMFIPVVKDLHQRTEVPVRRLLMPLAVGATLGGLLTMVGSAGNIVANTALTSAGFHPLSLFAITPLALLVLVVGVLFMRVFGRFLLASKKTGAVPLESQNEVLREYVTELTIAEDSPLVGKSLGETSLFTEHGITVVRLLRQGQSRTVNSSLTFEAGDSLLVLGDVDAITRQDHSEYGLTLVGESTEDVKARSDGSAKVLEVLIGHRSSWAGKTLIRLNLRRRWGLNVLGLYREGQLVYRHLASISLKVGDILLVQGTEDQISALPREHGLILLNEPTIKPATQSYAIWLAPTILLGSLLLAAFNVLEIQTAIGVGLLLMILTKMLDPADAYRAIEWRIIVFVAGIIPLSTALIQTGITAKIVHILSLVSRLASGHSILIAVLFLAAALLTQILSNIATVLVLGPVAAEFAKTAGLHPYPLVVAVMVAVSTSPLTPLANKVDLLIMGPGGYRYGDFLKLGIPFTLLMGALSTLAIPLFFPFH